MHVVFLQDKKPRDNLHFRFERLVGRPVSTGSPENADL